MTARFPALLLIAAASPLFAGFIPITQLTPFDDQQRSPRISGLAFDGQSNPWIIDGLSWQMQRLDATTGRMLETYSPQPAPMYNESLAWSPKTGTFYTANQTSLYSIALGSRTVVGSFPLFNFTSLAFDPQGGLWLGADNGGAELWRVNPTNAQLTFVTRIGIGTQLTALAITSDGQFYVAGYDGSLNTSSIYRIDPGTGAATWLTLAASGVGGFPALVVDFERQPGTGRWYAVEEQRYSSGRTYYFGELTGIETPEPGTVLLAAGGLALLIRRRKLLT